MGRKFKTWCFSFYRIKKKSVDDLSISMPGYNIFCKDISSKGGGVAIFVKEYLYFTKILSKSILIRTDSDSIWTFDSNYCIKLSNSSITVAGCYRPLSAPNCVLSGPPNSTYDSHLWNPAEAQRWCTNCRKRREKDTVCFR